MSHVPTIVIPNWREATTRLMTARPFGKDTLWLPVAGQKTDGTQDYSRVFGRDVIISAFELDEVYEMENHDFLHDALVFLASNQGRKPNPKTHEEPGKTPHELPGVTIELKKRRTMLNTLFCGCDPSLLFLIGCGHYARSSKFEQKTWDYLVPRAAASLEYVRAHYEEGWFLEDPFFCGAKEFALLATYWRDGGLPGRRGRHLRYPVAFLLVQAQMIAALREVLCLSRIRMFPGEVERLEGELEAARGVFQNAFHAENGGFIIAHDKLGPLVLQNTDPAHALWYLEPDDVNDAYVRQATEILEALETPWGWKTVLHAKTLSGLMVYTHKAGRLVKKRERERIWPWEHRFINEGLAKHGVAGCTEVALRPAKYLAGTNIPFAEFIELHHNKPAPAGCHVQLWTAAYWSWVERQCAAQQVQASG